MQNMQIMQCSDLTRKLHKFYLQHVDDPN